MTVGELDRARRAWKALDVLGSDEPLLIFKRGLCELMEDRLTEGIDLLERGIAMSDDDGLNSDMQGIIRKAEQALAEEKGVRPEKRVAPEKSMRPEPDKAARSRGVR